MTIWYWRLIQDFASITETLARLLRKYCRWMWNGEQETAFKTLKVTLSAVLAYASRTLSDARWKYSTTEQECLAKKFRHYLEGFLFTVLTDHSNLRWLHKLHNPIGRLARWPLELLEYSFEVVHHKGAQHKVPDALSRMFENDDSTKVCAVEVIDDPWYNQRMKDVIYHPHECDGWKVVEGLLYCFQSNPLNDSVFKNQEPWKLVIPSEKPAQVLQEVHDEAHAGRVGIQK